MKDFEQAAFLSTVSVCIGFAVGWMFRGRLLNNHSRARFVRSKCSVDGSNAIPNTDDVKLVLVVNNELKMGKGKIGAQCAHAALRAVEFSTASHPDELNYWYIHAQPKVVVKADNSYELVQLREKAISAGLASCVIADAGRTQIAPGSKTVLAIGPDYSSLIDKVTGHLKLL